MIGRSVALTVLVAVIGCGGGSVTGPSPVSDSGEVPVVTARVLPPSIYGAFVASADVPEAAANGGNVVLVLPSYRDDAEVVALALQANGQAAIVSAHHVFGGPRARWEQGWSRTREWMAPLEERGLVAAVYVVDEPLHNGISEADRDAAILRVAADGFVTITAEGIQWAQRKARPPSDLFGVTGYDWPGAGGWAQYRCVERYAEHPEWDLVIGQAFDLHPRNGTARKQFRAWAELGRDRAGVLFWVWRWDGQCGIGDDPALLAAYRESWR